MIEDVTFKCDTCQARVVVQVGYGSVERARLDGTINTISKKYDDPRDGDCGEFKFLYEQDRLRVRVPEGWDHRFGPKGIDYKHRCAECVKHRRGEA